MFLEPSGLLGVTPELLDNLPLFTLNRLSLVGPLPGGYELEVGALTPPNTSALPVEYSPVSCPPTRCPPASPSDACFFCLLLEYLAGSSSPSRAFLALHSLAWCPAR